MFQPLVPQRYSSASTACSASFRFDHAAYKSSPGGQVFSLFSREAAENKPCENSPHQAKKTILDIKIPEYAFLEQPQTGDSQDSRGRCRCTLREPCYLLQCRKWKRQQPSYTKGVVYMSTCLYKILTRHAHLISHSITVRLFMISRCTSSYRIIQQAWLQLSTLGYIL